MIILEKWERVIEGKKEASKFLRENAPVKILKNRWESGEGEEYSQLCRKVGKRIENSKLPENSVFIVSNIGSRVEILLEEKRITLFWIFQDTFYGRSDAVHRYCFQYLLRFEGALKACEDFLCSK